MTRGQMLGRVILKLFIFAVAIILSVLQCMSSYPSDNFEFLDFSKAQSGTEETAYLHPNTLIYDSSNTTVTYDDEGVPTVTFTGDTTLYYYIPNMTYQLTKAEQKYLSTATVEKQEAYHAWLAENKFGIRYGFFFYGADINGSLLVNGNSFLSSKSEYLSTSFTTDTHQLSSGEGYLFEIRTGNYDKNLEYQSLGSGSFQLKAYLLYDAPNRYYSMEENVNRFDAIPHLSVEEQLPILLGMLIGNVSSVPRLPQIFLVANFIYLFIIAFLLSIPYWGQAFKQGMNKGWKFAVRHLLFAPVTVKIMKNLVTGEKWTEIVFDGRIVLTIFTIFITVMISFIYQIIIAIPSLILDIIKLCSPASDTVKLRVR